MNTNDMIKVMQAYLDGKKLEVANRNDNNWSKLIGKPLWDWSKYEYRIEKKKLKFRIYKQVQAQTYFMVEEHEPNREFFETHNLYSLVSDWQEVEVSE